MNTKKHTTLNESIREHFGSTSVNEEYDAGALVTEAELTDAELTEKQAKWVKDNICDEYTFDGEILTDDKDKTYTFQKLEEMGMPKSDDVEEGELENEQDLK